MLQSPALPEGLPENVGAGKKQRTNTRPQGPDNVMISDEVVESVVEDILSF